MADPENQTGGPGHTAPQGSSSRRPIDNYQMLPKDEEKAPQPILKLRRPYIDEQYRARSLQILSISRPHARAFHYSWFAFFLSFCGWFALSPLLARIKKYNPHWLNKNNLFTSNIVAVSGTLIMRLFIGPFCDRFGPRIAMGPLLMVFAFPVGLVALARSYAAFTTLRFFIGFIGASFVVVQFWMSTMYSGPVVGTANAVAAGWGNLGGGFINAIMPVIVAGIQSHGVKPDNAWRYAQIIPAILLFITGALAFFIVDDAPLGNFKDLHREGTKTKTNPYVSMFRACRDYRTWILFMAYGASFGIEVLMNLNLATYAQTYFKISERSAGIIGGTVGLVNLFARALGGYLSDLAFKKHSLRGRLWVLWMILALEGVFLIAFSRETKLQPAIALVFFFAVFVDMCAGATYSVVPFIDPESTGAVSGVVGAGGNLGSILSGVVLRFKGAHDGFLYVGIAVLATSAFIPLIHWREHGSMFLPGAKTPGQVIEEDD